MESDTQKPNNPYGKSELIVEDISKDYDHVYELKSVIFRYFNAAGADPLARRGENHSPEPHLIPLILESHQKQGSLFLFMEHTIRLLMLHIYVTDLAEAH